MGGAAGHMLHPYEDLSLTLNDLLEMVECLSSKEVECYEKVDGLNINFKVTDNNVLFARNKTDVAAGGMTQEELFTRFADHPVGQSFMTASAMIKLWVQRKNVNKFPGSFGWVNCEIVDLNALNIINYTVTNTLGMKIVLHNCETHFEVLQKYCDDSRGNVLKPLKYVLPWGAHDKQTVQFHQRNITKLFTDDAVIMDDWTIADFLRNEVYNYLLPKMALYEINGLPLAWLVANKISGKMDPLEAKPFLTKLRKHCVGFGMRHVYDAVYELCASKNIKRTRSLFLRPLEMVWHNFTSHLLHRQKSHLLMTCKGEEMKRIKNNLQEAKKEVKGMEWQWQKLGPIGLLDQGIEGIVFKYQNEKIYKLTGQFAPVNQILGALKFGR